MIDLIKAALWPAIVLLILFLFYAPLHNTLESLSQRSDDIQTIKVGSLEINVRPRDLPTPKEDVANVLRVLDVDMIKRLVSHLESKTGGPCYHPDEKGDPRFALDSKLADLGLIKLAKVPNPESYCPVSYTVTATQLGQDSGDFLLRLIAAQVGTRKPAA
jgi:hypothetical protein